MRHLYILPFVPVLGSLRYSLTGDSHGLTKNSTRPDGTQADGAQLDNIDRT
jgi:hypothetical protein